VHILIDTSLKPGQFWSPQVWCHIKTHQITPQKTNPGLE